MNGGYTPPPGSGHGGYEYEKIPRPKKLKEIPEFLSSLLGGLFNRLFYIFVLVWKTDPVILLVMLFMAVFDGVVPVIGSIITKDVLNEMQDGFANGTLSGIAENEQLAAFLSSAILSSLIILFVYRIIQRVVNRVSNAIIRIAGEKVVRQVKVQIMEKSKTLDLASFDNAKFYEKLENANREAGNRPIQTLQSTFSVLSTVISLVSYFVIILKIPNIWWMPVGIVLISVPSAIVSFVYRKKNFQYMRNRSKDRRQMNYYSDLLVNKDAVKEIRIFNLSDTFIGRYVEVFNRYFKGLRKLILSEAIWMIAIAIISAAVNCFFYAFIAFGVFRGLYKVGDYNLYTGALTSIANCVTTLISTSAAIYEGTLFIDNLICFMNEKTTIMEPAAAEKPKLEHGVPHTITFDHVSFRYPGTQRNVINDVSTTFRPGETVVLVGLNGAGKTTLIKLLTRLYDPTEGRILLDGKDLREYDVKDLYSIFGIIFQDYNRYAVSARENVEFGDIDRNPDETRVLDSIEQANASEYISKLPNGVDTPLMRIFEPTGIELSGGQWQKLAIARAFYRDSDILILDEPTASLDPMAEQEVFNQFDNLRGDKMTIFVSHRLSSAVIATKIMVLENGCLIEEGTHKELMEAHGQYYTLFSVQAKRYIEGGKEILGEEAEDEEKSAAPEGERARRSGGEGRPRRRRGDSSAFDGTHPGEKAPSDE